MSFVIEWEGMMRNVRPTLIFYILFFKRMKIVIGKKGKRKKVGVN